MARLTSEIARRVGGDRKWVRAWVRRLGRHRLASLRGAPSSGRPRKFSLEEWHEVLVRTASIELAAKSSSPSHLPSVAQVHGIWQCQTEPRNEGGQEQSQDKNDQIRHHVTRGFFHGRIADRTSGV
jgi:hypothetical protein